MRQYFQAQIQHMAQDTVLAMIDTSELARIKAADSNPEIRVYVVGHEGMAQGPQLGFGERVWKYAQAAIKKLYEAIYFGTPIFNRHAPGSNDVDGRPSIGRVVGKKLETINDKLSTLVAVYIFPQYRNEKLDVASIESEVAFTVDGGGIAEVKEFDYVSGIALGDSEKDSPGFPGATMQAAIQAFSTPPSERGDNPMTLEEIKAAIEAGNFTPAQIFSAETLSQDTAIKNIVREKTEKVQGYAQRKDEKIEELEGKIVELESAHSTEVKGLKAEAIKGAAGKTFDALAGERKLTERQKAFIAQNMGEFSSDATDADGLKPAMNTFIDSQLGVFDKVASIFGVTQETPSPGTPAGDGDQAGDSADLTDPENNPLIPA